MVLHRFDMSRFRAINQPSETPVGQSLEPGQASRGQLSARAFAVLLPPSTQTHDQSKSKGSSEEAVSKPKKTSQKLREKKRDSNFLLSKPQRVPAPREKKINLVSSIEYTPRKTGDSPTPKHTTNGTGSEYCPSIKLSESFQSPAPITPPQRNPRKHESKCASAGSSPVSKSSPASSLSQVSSQDGAALGLVKQECASGLQAGSMGRPPSPLIWNRQARQKRYKEAEFVELPKEVFEYKKLKKELALKKEAMRSGKRKEKGKVAEQPSVEETCMSTSRTSKRKTKDQVEHIKPRKRQKSRKHHIEDHSITDDGNGKEVSQTSKGRSPQKPPKEKVIYPPESARYHKRYYNDSSKSNTKFAQDFLFTREQDKSNTRRKESSIAPHVFYGDQGKYRPPTNSGSSSQFVPEMNSSQPSLAPIPKSVHTPNESINDRTPSKAFPTRYEGRNTTGRASFQRPQPPSHHTAINSNHYLTSPHSFAPGKRPGPAVPSHPYTSPRVNSGNGNLGIRQISKPLSQDTSGVKPISFKAQRRRYRSVPIGIYSKKSSNEQDPIFSPTPRRNDNTLHEVSNNAIVIRLEMLEKAVRDRFPAAASGSPVTAIQPVTAPAPAPVPVPATAPAPASAPTATSANQPPRRCKRQSAAQRKITHPVLDPNVPQHLCKTEDEIIEIGRNTRSYERHRRAPEAFGWNGRLRARFKYLFARHVGGVSVWTAEEISRLSR